MILFNTLIESNSYFIGFRTLYEESKRVEEHLEISTDVELQFQKKRLASYRTEIKAIRKERDVNSRSEKELIKSI